MQRFLVRVEKPNDIGLAQPVQKPTRVLPTVQYTAPHTTPRCTARDQVQLVPHGNKVLHAIAGMVKKRKQPGHTQTTTCTTSSLNASVSDISSPNFRAAISMSAWMKPSNDMLRNTEQTVHTAGTETLMTVPSSSSRASSGGTYVRGSCCFRNDVCKQDVNIRLCQARILWTCGRCDNQPHATDCRQAKPSPPALHVEAACKT